MPQSPKLSPEPDLVERFSITISKLEEEIELCEEEIALLDPEDDRTSLEEQLGKRLKRLQRLLAQRDEAFEARKTSSSASRKMGHSKRQAILQAVIGKCQIPTLQGSIWVSC